jgi:dihydroorotase
MSLLIKNVTVANADGVSKAPQDILIERGSIAKVGAGITAAAAKVIDASGKIALPGFIDLHVHLREPGREDKETIETGSRAAAKGGFTTIFCMPNTTPVIDNAMIVEAIVKEAKRVGLVNVIPVGAITKGQKDEELVDMFELKAAGCLALSDDGKSVYNPQTMRFALDYARMTGLLLMQHCQDPHLSAGGVMNEGFTSTLLGMKGDPVIAETVMIARDIELVRYLKTRIHFQHVSTRRAVELIRGAKKDGVAVTAEVTPHHFSLTEEAVKKFDPNTKVNPPLRTADDVVALKEGLKDGTIDCIATDHAPHTREDKEVGFDLAPSGMIGLETAFGLAVTELIRPGVLTWAQLAEKMSAAPARIMGLANKGKIVEGYDADITLVDPKKEVEVTAKDFVSKSSNSPFAGKILTGAVEVTINGGRVVYRA